MSGILIRVAVAIAFCVVLAGGSFVSGYSYAGKRFAEKVAEQTRQAAENTHQLQEKIASLEEKYHDDQQRADNEISDLNQRIAAGKLRLSVRSNCQTAGNTAGSNGETRAELNPEDAKNLISIAEDGDRAIRKLGVCQDILTTISQ